MDDDEEDYVLFGTPLPEIEDEATLRKKAEKELQVRDERGRQRFHGAFTGGFSAGYFNTVGTKEGWAPSSFISSRNKTADRIQQNPEDFMDDEDLGEFGIATRKIHTTSNFQDSSTTHKRRYIDSDNVIPGEAPLKDIVQPIRESIGVLILKKLGWRQGQGIGPRVKKYSAATKVYGCSPFPDSLTPEEDDPMAATFTFAPEDSEGMSYKSKDNYFGLGYSGLSKQSVLSSSIDLFAPTTTKSWLPKDKRKLKISGQAFGVGAFEDEDEDIYGKDDMSQYDFSDLAPKVSAESKAIEPSKSGNSQGVLDGFQLASQPPLVKKHYPPPTLPPHFKPVHMKSVSSIYKEAKPTNSRHALSASDRSIILGEKTFQIASLSAPAVVEEKQKPSTQPVHALPSSSASSVNFRPFPNDLLKQQRYEEYLILKGKGDVGKLVQPSTMTEWEKQQELEEFAQASVLFKPLSNALQSRFESRSHLSVEHEVMAALEKLKKEKMEQVVIKKNLVGSSNRKTFEWHPVSLLCKRMNVPNPYPNSDSSGTQSIHKTKSVFDHLAFSSEKTSFEKRVSSSLPASSRMENKFDISSTSTVDQSPKQVTDTSTTVKNDKELPPQDEKPPIDFFKDIFGNTSSEDETDGENTKPKEEVEINDGNSGKSPDFKIIEDNSRKSCSLQEVKDTESDSKQKNVKNSSASKKVGFGVFANLDLDALNQRKPTEKLLQPDAPKSENNNNNHDACSESNVKSSDCVEKEPESNNFYGPELPPNYSVSDTVVSTPSVYETSPKKHSKSKSSHKHKHHKHKHKKKKKKSHKKRSSSSESSEELDDIPPSMIIERIKKLQKRKS